MKLNRKISLATGMFTTSMLLIMGVLVAQQWFSTLRNQLELTAQDMAFTISEMEIVQFNLTRSNGSIPIQRRMDELKLSTRIQYIHILNNEGLYYSHTQPSRVGTLETDPFILSILTSHIPRVQVRRTGTSRLPAVEAVAPVYYQGELAGVVVTGLLNGRVYQEIKLNIMTFCLFIILAVFISLYSSKLLSYSIKKSMSGLEPDEISRLLGQRAMTLENLKEGIITVDQRGRIIYFNAAAAGLTGFNPLDLDKPVDGYFCGGEFRTCLEKRAAVESELVSPAGVMLQCRFEPISTDPEGELLGATAILEDLSTVRLRAEELTGIKQINEGLRAQNHEFLNKLHTISGMIQLEEYNEAVQFITGVSRMRQEVISQMSGRIKDSSVAGLLLAKYNKAQEQKCAFILDEQSFLSGGTDLSDTLNLILGNLIENSLEELKGHQGGRIRAGIFEGEDSIMLHLDDNGSGFPADIDVFERGQSSRGMNRGLGLALVRERLNRVKGSIHVVSNTAGTSFEISIPCERRSLK